MIKNKTPKFKAGDVIKVGLDWEFYTLVKSAGSVTIDYPHELSGMEGHAKAAYALLTKMHWDYKLVGGQLPSHEYAFVMLDPASNV